MKLEVLQDPDGTPLLTTVYEGADLDLMREAIVEFISDGPAFYQKHCLRWFDIYGRGYAEDGLEPEFRIQRAGVTEQWKIYQEVGS